MGVFKSISVYPISPTQTQIYWEFNPGEFLPAGPLVLTLEMSRSGHDEWGTVRLLDPYDPSVGEIVDTSQRSWSVADTWFYRIRITGTDGTVYSPVEPAWGSLPRGDRLKMREMYRQECLRRKFTGSKGILFKRKHWGIEPEYARTNQGGQAILDPDTGEIVNHQSATGKGTAFNGGYYTPVTYWLDLGAGETRKIDQTELGTNDNFSITASGMAFPLPRSKDMWQDCTSGKRYFIESVVNKTKIRHIPVVVDLVLKEIPMSDVAYTAGEGSIEITPGVYVEPTDWSRSGFRFRGPYTPGNAYLLGDVVIGDDGYFYVAGQDGNE